MSIFIRRAAIAATVAGLSVAVVAPSLAQVKGSAAKHPGALVLRADGNLGLDVKSAAQRTALLAAADPVLAIMRRDDALMHPIGYSTVVHRAAGVTGAGGETLAPGVPPHYAITGSLAYYINRADGTIDDQGGSVPIAFIVNGVGRIEDNESVTLPLDGGPPVLRNYRVTSQFRGHPVYNGECVVVARRPNSVPFAPLTKERYLKLQILQARADSVRHSAQHAANSGNSSSAALAAWIRDRPKREADMQSTLATISKVDPKSGKEFADIWRKSEAEAEARLREAAKGDGDQRIKDIEKSATVGEGQRIAELQAQLDALSPLQRISQAAAIPMGLNIDKLGSVDDADSEPFVQINTAFFDKSLAATVPQVITVCIPGLQAGIDVVGTEWNDQRAHDSALIRDHLDWAALEALVTQR